MDDFPALPIQGTYEENEKPAIGHHLPKLGKVSAEQTDRLFYRYSCQMRAEDPYKMRCLLLTKRTKVTNSQHANVQALPSLEAAEEVCLPGD